jgi:hypothetical protein
MNRGADQAADDAAFAERCVSSLRIVSSRREFREAGYFERGTQAEELRELLSCVLEQARRGELGPAVTSKRVRGIEILLAALDPTKHA